MICGACGAQAPVYAVVDGYEFADCPVCESLAIDGYVIDQIDRGEFARTYDEDYWTMELSAARARAGSDGISRVAEAMIYARRRIGAFIDIGSGPGFLLDSLSRLLPSKHYFYGVEKFPPGTHTDHPNYRIGDLADLDMKFDGGVCIEMLEHLTPNMAGAIVDALASKSNPGAFYLFNTGLPMYVRNEDPGYLDPLRRGHIISWGEPALRRLFEPRGFAVIPMRSWAFGVEYDVTNPLPLDQRIWDSPNKDLLQDPMMGDIMYMLGRETARAHAPPHMPSAPT